MAVIGWLPMLRLFSEKEAVPVVALNAASGWVASRVAPSLKATEPVGVAEVEEELVTVAVNVTDWPYGAGLSDEARALRVASPVTVWVPEKEIPL